MSSGVIEDIKSKLDIVQIVGEHLQLKKAGASWRACCPFHGEKTPSFFVNPDRQFFHCFGCGESGDVFAFLQRMEGIDFPEAKKILARRAGIELKYEDPRLADERQRLLDANRLAALYWHEVLLRAAVADRARAYVQKRALTEKTVEDFLIGYAPDAWETTCGFLRQKGFRDDELLKAGLVSKSERGSGVFDRFRGRLMFPIRDGHGNTVGFTGRVMPGPDGKDPDGEAKYVNTSQTPVYNKSHILFGLDKAKSEIRKQGVAVIVEGNMDVVSAHQAGFTNVVASSGTALTADQLTLLKRLTGRLVLSFDNDKAGETAVRRGIDAAVAMDFVVRVLRLPPGAGKDPDDCVRQNPDLWRQAVAEAAPYMDWLIGLAKSRTDFHDPDAKKRAAQELLAEVVKMKEPVEQSHWIRQLATLFDTPESLLFERVAKYRSGEVEKWRGGEAGKVSGVLPAKPGAPTRQTDRYALVSEYFLAMVIRWPEYAETGIAAVRPEFMDDGTRELYRNFIVNYNSRQSGGNMPVAPLAPLADAEEARLVAVLELRAEKEFGELSPDGRRAALGELMGEIKRLRIDRRIRELKQAMVTAEAVQDQAGIRDIQRQMDELLA